ncbi:MAG: phenylacetate--CoA ligase family protein [Opitutus sp.]|nr:phenylacetate--CoA ligase family protein [Opitutus sp.]
MSGLAQQQLAALNGLIAAIAPTNRFYRRRLTAADGLGGFASLADFRARMPFTTKEELARDQEDNPPHGSTLTYPLETYTRFHQTSGTSGRPLVWLDDRDSWQWVLENWKIVWQKAGAVRGDAACFAFSFGPFLGFWAAFDSAVQQGLRALPAGGMSSADRLRLLLAQRPRFLCCTPTYALRLAEVARVESLDLRATGVERILVAGEPGGSIPETRARIEQSWPGAQVVDHHGMTEIGPVSYGLPDQPAVLRLMHQAYFCEVLEPGGVAPVTPGENGELVLTTLGRFACPLLRYRTGDLVKPIELPGEDPAAFALGGGILGRVDDMVVVRGVNLYPGAVDAVVRAVAGVQEYLVEIDQRGTLPEVTVRFEATVEGHDPGADLAKQLRGAFSLRIEVEKVARGTLPVFEMKARRWKILT